MAVKFLAVSLPKPLCNGRFTSETAVRRFQKWNRHLDPEVVKIKKIRWDFRKALALDIIVFQGGDDGRGYRNMCKIAGGSNLNLGHWCMLYVLYVVCRYCRGPYAVYMMLCTHIFHKWAKQWIRKSCGNYNYKAFSRELKRGDRDRGVDTGVGELVYVKYISYVCYSI